jgi:predicted unusual protein kinase regulating ubiquinone biosynthesis (AarF/ABC1/UbiB family)
MAMSPSYSDDRPPSTDQRAYRWNRENYSRRKRFIDVWTFVVRLLGARWLYQKPWSYRRGMTDLTKAARRRRLAVWIRETMLDLGPTFIKLGQLFSTRSDLFAAEFVEELSKLQDRVPAFSFEQVSRIIETELGKPLGEIYPDFEPVPIAAASLGQVHRAHLPGGEEVVVKIQRPGLSQLFTIDLEILKGIAKYFQNHRDWGRGRDWMGIYDECCKILWEEIDYLNEGRNADLFRRNFRDYDWIQVPRVFWRYASPRTLTLEYLPGIKISHYEALEAAGLDRKALADASARAYLMQILDAGFFHADPHPGNIAVSAAGQLIFYDFGMMGRIQTITREKMMGLFFGVAQKDAQQVVAALVDLGALSDTGDSSAIRRSIQYMLDNFMDKPFEEQSLNAISEDLYEIAYDQPFRFPATFTFVMRAFSTLEGVGKGLDPNFNFMEIAQPFAMRLMSNGNPTTDLSNLLGDLGRQASQASNSALGLPRRLDETLDRLDRGDLRVRVKSSETDRLLRQITSVNLGTNFTMISCACIISATLLVVNGLAWFALIPGVAAGASGFAFLRIMLKLQRLP